MGFWKNVENELDYLGKSRKELAAEANFDVSYISKGIERNSIPIADTALRIAKALNVSLEYLLDFDLSKTPAHPPADLSNEEIKLFHKFKPTIEKLKMLDHEELALLEQIADKFQKNKNMLS